MMREVRATYGSKSFAVINNRTMVDHLKRRHFLTVA